MPEQKSQIEQDMLALAELVYEISKKHGGIYINACCTKDSSHSWTTYQVKNMELVDATYWPKE